MTTSSIAAGVSPELQFVDCARKYGTPLYVYDLRRLRGRVCKLRSVLAGARAQLFFATMANDRDRVLRLLSSLGVGACVNSIPHLMLAKACGFSPEQIQFTSTGIAADDMCVLQRLCIRTNLDSLSQVEKWFKLGATDAGIRINAASLERGASPNRIGIEASDLTEAIAIATRCRGCLTGIHIYVGTNFQHSGEILPTLEAFFDLAQRVPSLRYVNIGGGIGINYRHDGPEFDTVAFGNGICKYAKRLCAKLKRQIEVIFEPGRGLTAECGTFVTSITDLKMLARQRYVAVDGSVAVFPRPLHHPETPHRIRPLTATTTVQGLHQRILTTVVGRTTFSRDILGSALLPDNLQVGDLLAVDDAGAYSQSMASRFLGQPEPHEVFVD